MACLQVRGVEVGIVLLVLLVWIGAIVLFFNRWGKIRMLLPYQPDYKEQLKVPGTGACGGAGAGSGGAGGCSGQHASSCSQVRYPSPEKHPLVLCLYHDWTHSHPCRLANQQLPKAAMQKPNSYLGASSAPRASVDT